MVYFTKRSQVWVQNKSRLGVIKMGGQNYSEQVYMNIFPVSFQNLLSCSLLTKIHNQNTVKN